MSSVEKPPLSQGVAYGVVLGMQNNHVHEAPVLTMPVQVLVLSLPC